MILIMIADQLSRGKKILWLLPLFTAVANCYYNENVHRMMGRTII